MPTLNHPIQWRRTRPPYLRRRYRLNRVTLCIVAACLAVIALAAWHSRAAVREAEIGVGQHKFVVVR